MPSDSSKRARFVFGALFCATGAALVVYVVAGFSLLWGAALAIGIGGAVGYLLWRRAPPPRRLAFRRAIVAGSISGVLATAAYDAFRWALIRGFDYTIWPFDIFEIFGKALFGEAVSGSWVTLAGFGYHVANGLGFGIAYAVWFGKRGVLWGIGWAMALEVLQVSIYPGWLKMPGAAFGEFLQISAFGHLIYGVTLGLACRWLLTRGETNG